MNQLGIAVVTAAVQVTLLALVATAWYGFARRRGPAAGSWSAAATLGACGLLGLFALCPLPSWWAWQSALAFPAESAARVKDTSSDFGARKSAARDEAPEQVDTAATSDRTQRGFGVPLSAVGRWLGGLNRYADGSGPVARSQWSVVIAVAFVVGVLLGLARLVAGFWAVHRCCRHSAPVTEPSIQSMLQGLLREMNAATPVNLREATCLKTAATAGWLRPVILLPAGWREWCDAERRAVLAHEVAHICRRDYLAWIIARVSMVLNFYHPWVHWMVHRLQLEQELATDALATRFAGGRAEYVRVLARMALRQEKDVVYRPAWAFLPASGTFLMRRIQMLRSKKSVDVGSFRRTGRLIAMALLAALAFGLSGLRTPAASARPQSDDAKTETKPAAAAGNADDTAPDKVADKQPAPVRFKADADDLIGVFAVRPNIFFDLPGMKPHAEFINKAFVELEQQSGLPAESSLAPALPVQEIELISLPIYLSGPASNAAGSRWLFCSVEMVRTAKEFDWKQYLKKIAPELSETTVAGKSLLKAPNVTPAFFPINISHPMLFHLPDDRTLAFPLDEHKLRGMFEAGQEWRPLGEFHDGWDRVKHGCFALAIDNRDNRVGRRALKPDDSLEPVLAPLFENIRNFVLSVEAGDRLVIQAFATCETEEGAKIVAEQTAALLTLARNAIRQHENSPELADEQKALLEVAKDLFKHVDVACKGTEVSLRIEAKVDLAELLGRVLTTGL